MRLKSNPIFFFIFMSFFNNSYGSQLTQAKGLQYRTLDETIDSLWNDTGKIENLLETYSKLDVHSEPEENIQILLDALISDYHPDKNPFPKKCILLSGEDCSKDYFKIAKKVLTNAKLNYMAYSFTICDAFPFLKENPNRNFNLIGEIELAIYDLLSKRSLLSLYKNLEVKDENLADEVLLKDNKQDQFCPICLYDFEEGECKVFSHRILEDDFHGMHKECFKCYLDNFYYNNDSLPSCCHKNCDLEVHLPNIINALFLSDRTDVSSIVHKLIKKYLENQDKVQIMSCPACSAASAFEGEDFNQMCWICDRDLCFSCGKPSHRGIDCISLDSLNQDQLAVLALKKNENIGRCPHCKIILEKKDGCSDMVCGANARDKKFIGRVRGKGCGKKFQWGNRLKL